MKDYPLLGSTGYTDDDPKVRMTTSPEEAEELQWFTHLSRLREPFPPERIEKLPKPMSKNAWVDQPKSHCDICGGYHPRAGTIHLDYVGHANTTDRLLEVDPCWSWEPMAYTEDGLPLFSNGGLWIKLTILGVTRIGFGDGASVKEVIGDAIRNAAMRFGVALDLWAKVDLHESVNPATPRRRSERGDVHGQRLGARVQAGGSDQVAADPAPNQDALAALGSICDQHGYDRRSCGAMFEEWAKQQDHDVNPRLIDADSDDINLFAASLIVMATTEGDPVGDSALPTGDVDDSNADGEAQDELNF